MVMDFSDLKTIVNKLIVKPFDHATVLNVNSPHKELADSMEQGGHKIIRVNYQPTSEMMVIDFAEKIRAALPPHLKLTSSNSQRNRNLLCRMVCFGSVTL